MKVTIVRSGGFAGIRSQLGPVDTLEFDGGGVVVRKIQEIGFFDLPAELPGTGSIRDGFNYAITVEADEGTHTVGYDDASDRAAVTPLYELQQVLVSFGFRFRPELPEALATEGEDDGFTWEAWYNRMPGSHDPNLYVVGTRTFESSSIVLTLKPDNPGIVPQPGFFRLRLTIHTPDAGDDRMSEEQAVWIGDVGPRIERVGIQGDARAVIPVQEIS